MDRLWLLIAAGLVLVGCRAEPEGGTAKRNDTQVDGTISQAVESRPLNRGPGVQDGFRGAVHPALAGDWEMTVSASASPIGVGRGYEAGYFPPKFRRPFDKFRVAEKSAVYTAKDFSAFLPEQFEEVGQTWEIDMPQAIGFLKPLHRGVKKHLAAPGRLPGPDGGFAVLRAVSSTHYEILCRMHAEFTLDEGFYLTPSCFEGRLLLNRERQTVDAFTLNVPDHTGLNVTLTVGLPTEALIDIIHVEQMGVHGGKLEALDAMNWSREMPFEEARRKLKSVFYKFVDIAWVPADSAVKEAQRQQKPILAVVLWGDLDDQSC